MEYKIVSAFEHNMKASAERLEETINSLIEQGWIPQGGVSPAGSLGLRQAMVRDETEAP